jgi:ATP-dependent DNA helicase RecG
MHLPTSEADLAEAKRRFAFEELFRFSVQSSIFSLESAKKRVAALDDSDLSDFFASLPFSLTAAQKRAIDEIRLDLCGTGEIPPMDRLLQGDVGSGKTIVAAAAAYLVAKNGKSTLIMAPTEILAKQHAENFSKLFAPFHIPVFLLTGSTTKKEREEIFSHTTGTTPYVLIGTHALIEDKTRCGSVLLTITDEQHRFGVRHRNLLGEKGGAIHSLVMSATPIPRSLAMFLHAKSRISVIDELPPGRQAVDTLYVGEDKLDRIYTFLKEQIEAGRQAYIVCPLIEDEEVSTLISAADQKREVEKQLPSISSELLHGKMKAGEKSAVMERFSSGETKLLVSTTVIEVGVDVPNATVMCIRCAERFGLSQLHQLRGRVGRGKEKSYCILVSSHSGKNARQRLKKLCDCHDGFELAQYDLKTRGPGEFFGTRQSGFGADPISDAFSMEMIRDAGDAARMFLESASEAELAPYAGSIRLN